MYYISQPPGVSLEEHITLLEEKYSQAFEDSIDPGVMEDIWNQIQALHEKLSKQAITFSFKETA